MTTVDTATIGFALDDLASRLRGELVRPDDSGYDEARSVWNGMIDVWPAAIARCASAEDVKHALVAARRAGLPIAVRGGGHNVAGFATIDRGLVIDLSPMRTVDVDAVHARVRAGGGVTLADLDAATQAHGLVVPAGVVSETGIAGLTLSGGLGWLRRKWGLTCDNLVGATLVTADGAVLAVDDQSDPELLWGLRGGGGNFGIVTDFEFRAHPLGPEVAFLFVLYPIDAAHHVIVEHERLVEGSGDDLSTIVVLGHVPPLEDFPRETHQVPYVAVVGMFAGPPEEGEEAIRPLRTLGDVLVDFSGRMAYVDAQRVYDPDYPAGHRYYWKSTNARRLPPEAVDVLVERMRAAPSKHSTIDVWLNGGAMSRIDESATAFGGRDVRYLINPEGNWEDPEHDDANVAWVRGVLAELETHSAGGTYLNFPGFLEEGSDMVRASHGSNYPRLQALKARLDPENVFSRNANVEPSPGAPSADSYDAIGAGRLEAIWGDGYLSPGGDAEVGRIVAGVSVAGATVLDIACGTGGAAFALLEEHDAGSVVGVDISAHVVAKASDRAGVLGLSDRTRFQLIAPGPLPFPDCSFDVVFSKDAFIHIEDKAGIYEEAFRVLRPGGWLCVGDWLRGEGRDMDGGVAAFIEAAGEDFSMHTLREAGECAADAGFAEVELTDRRDWYHSEASAELERLVGTLRDGYIDAFGSDAHDRAIEFWSVLVDVTGRGILRPGHIRARKPVDPPA